MAEIMKNKCLSDITTSESSLARFGLICEIMAQAKVYDSSKLFKVIEEKTGLTNSKVIGRHLHILSILELLQRESGRYIITSRGKVLSRARIKNDEMLEKVIFFRSFFCNIPNQLFYVIHVVGKNESKAVEKNAFDYYLISNRLNPCGKSTEDITISKIVASNPDAFLRRSMLNRFETMVCWLLKLNLLQKDNALWLTKRGQLLFNTLQEERLDDLPANIYFYAAKVYGSIDPKKYVFDSTTKSDFIRVLREASYYFRSEQNLSDLIAIQEYISAFYATKGYVLDERKFYDIVQDLGLDGTIRSVILGRDGKPAYLIMDDSYSL